MTDMDDIRVAQHVSTKIYTAAVQIREILQKVETDLGKDAAERALAIVTGDEE